MIRIITLSGRAATAKGTRQILLSVFFQKGLKKLFWAKFGVIMHYIWLKWTQKAKNV